MLNGKVERRIETLKQFVVNALAMGLLIQAYPGVGQLLNALRYRVQTECLPGFGSLSFVTVQACLDSFRPSDKMLLTTTAFSRVPAFVELIRATRSRAISIRSRNNFGRFLASLRPHRLRLFAPIPRCGSPRKPALPNVRL